MNTLNIFNVVFQLLNIYLFVIIVFLFIFCDF